MYIKKWMPPEYGTTHDTGHISRSVQANGARFSTFAPDTLKRHTCHGHICKHSTAKSPESIAVARPSHLCLLCRLPLRPPPPRLCCRSARASRSNGTFSTAKTNAAPASTTKQRAITSKSVLLRPMMASSTQPARSVCPRSKRARWPAAMRTSTMEAARTHSPTSRYRSRAAMLRPSSRRERASADNPPSAQLANEQCHADLAECRSSVADGDEFIYSPNQSTSHASSTHSARDTGLASLITKIVRTAQLDLVNVKRQQPRAESATSDLSLLVS